MKHESLEYNTIKNFKNTLHDVTGSNHTLSVRYRDDVYVNFYVNTRSQGIEYAEKLKDRHVEILDFEII